MKIASLLAVVALSMGSVAGAIVSTASKPAAGKHAFLPRSSRFQTPYERLLLPALRNRLAAHITVKGQSVPAEDSSMSQASPNFGAFVAASNFPAHLSSACIVSDNCGLYSVDAADFDQDGKPDVAVVQYDGTLDILLNDGAGGFKTPVAYSNPNYLTTSAQQVLAVDVNHDGFPDVLVLDSSANDLIVYLNQKNGTFLVGQPVNFTFNYGSVNAIAVGDVNGDGKLDIVTVAANVTSVTDTQITVQTYLGNGDGTFAQPTAALTNTVNLPTVASIPSSPNGLALGDLNKDGKLDLAMTIQVNESQFLVDVAMGHGDGSFGALNVSNPINMPMPYAASTAGVQMVDVNGDGNLDLASDIDGNLLVALGDGTGNFQVPIQAANLGQLTTGVYADVNGDGKLDLVADVGYLQVANGKGDGTFQLAGTGSFVIDEAGSPGIALADFNGDGSLDIAQIGGDYRQLSLFSNDGKGNFHGAPLLNSTADSVVLPNADVLQAAADFNGNGLSDILFVDASDSNNPYVSAGISDGKGNFSYTTAISPADTTNLAFVEPVQADLNGDGKQDILYAGLDGGLYVALSNGEGSFQSPKPLSLPMLDCPLSYGAVADLNGDGKPDVVVAYPGDASCGGANNTPSGYFVALGNGDGTFQTPTFNANGTTLYSVTVGDFNMDGVPDLILDDAPVHGGGNFQVSFLPGNGDGTFGLGGSVLSDYMVTKVIAGDYNQDGKPDLILLSSGEQSDQGVYDTAGIMLLPGNGDGTFGAVTSLGVGNIFGDAALSDVNGDGIPDLAVLLEFTNGGSTATETYDGFAVLLGQGGGVFAPPVNELTPTGSPLILQGNFFNDNAPDFVVSTSEGMALYLGQGGTSLSLSTSAASVPFGADETLTATVSPTMVGRPTPSGTASFYDGTTLLGSSTLNGGKATFTANNLAVGSHTITSVYSGNINFNVNSSAATGVTVTTLAPAIKLTASASTLSVAQGAQGSVTLTLAANATFSGQVMLSCSGTKVPAACAVSPTAVTLSPGSTTTATLIVGTTSAAAANRGTGFSLRGSVGAVVLGALLFAFRRRRLWLCIMPTLACAMLMFGATMMSGCGGGGTSKSNNGSTVPVAQKGSFVVTVAAAPATSSAATQSIAVTVSVE